MREIDKKIDNSIKRKKQMRTTTFAMALLVAAIMISSTIPAMTVSDSTQMNVNTQGNGDTKPLDAGNDKLSSNPVTSLTNSGLPKEMQYNPESRIIVVWDNSLYYSSACASQDDGSGSFDCHQADDFIFTAVTKVSGARWIAGFWNGAPVEFDWAIRFWVDDGTGNAPGTLFAGPFDIAYGDMDVIDLGGQYYDYSADLGAIVTFQAGQKYWVDIYSNSVPMPQVGVCQHSNVIMHMAVWGSDYFSIPYWTNGDLVLGYVHDMAFQLFSSFEHDVGISEIVSPVDYQDLCECLPVTVKVANYGLNDEVNVPVHVEIFQNAPGYPSSFDESFPGFWYNYYGWNNLWSVVYGPQGNVIPHDYYWGAMARFDGSSGTWGYNVLASAQVDFTQACSPKMCFYMWHDAYGSDDYVQVYLDAGNGQIPISDPFYRLTCDAAGWYKHCIDLSAYAGQTIQIGFLGMQDGVMGAYDLFIDDVSLYDAAYDETVYVDINAGETVEIELPDFCPCQWNLVEDTAVTYTITAYTEMIGDEYAPNDGITDTSLIVYYPFYHDVGAISIDSPTGENLPAGTFEMCSTIKNFGQYTECCFQTYMSVAKGYLTPGWTEYTQDFSYWPSYYYAPPPWTDEHDAYYYYYGWYQSYSSYSGGISPEAYLPYYYCLPDYKFYSGALSTVGMPAPEVTAKSYINHYGGSGLYTLKAGYSTNGVTWTEAWSFDPASSQQFTIDFALPSGLPTVYVGFWVIGDPFYFNYWYLDDVTLYQPDVHQFYTPEWTDSVCIEQIDVCQELQVCFDDWTPAIPWPECGTNFYQVCSWTNMCDPLDENVLNDKVCTEISVDFWHDVAIKEITSPAFEPKGDLIFTQGIYQPDESWNFYTSSLGLGYIAAEDFWDLTDDIGAIEWIGLSMVCCWTNVDPAGFTFEIIFYEDNAGVPGDAVATFEVADGDATYTEYADYSGYQAWTWHYDLPDCVALENGWVSIQSTYHPSDGNLLWGTGPDGNNNGEQNWVSTGGNFAYSLFACEGGAPKPDVYIPCGEQDLTVIVENLGTFQENDCTVYWELYEWITDPLLPTLAASGSVDDIDLSALGGTQTVTLGTYDFASAGIYQLIVWIVPLGTDCDWDNNLMDIGIGVDCCPPETTYTLTPAAPNGQNNWYTSDVTVKLTAVDPPCPDPCVNGVISGIDKIYYKLNGVAGTINGATGTFKITTDGNNLVEFWAVDNVGNEEVHHTFTVALDKTKPTVELVFEAYQDDSGNWKVDFTALAADATSGVNKVEFKKDTTLLTTITGAGPYKYTYSWTDGDGTKTFYAYVYDNAGNSNSDSVVVGSLAKNLNIQGQGLAKTLPKVLVESK